MPSESMKRTSRGHPKSTHLHNEMDVRKGKTTITCGSADNMVTITDLIEI